MLILIAKNPQKNSYVASLISAYEKAGHTVICSHHNFYSSNIVPDILHILWSREFFSWYPFLQKEEGSKLSVIKERLTSYKDKGSIIIFSILEQDPKTVSGNKFEKAVSNLIFESASIISYPCVEYKNKITKLNPLLSTKINIVIRYGDFLLNYENISKETARRKLKIPVNKFVILNFENQQSAGNEDFVRKVFKACPANYKYLLVAGDYDYEKLIHYKKYFYKLIYRLKERNRFTNRRYIFRTIREAEIPFIFSASDIVLISDKTESSSWIIPMAATYCKPVIYPNSECYREQINNWIGKEYIPQDSASAAHAIYELSGKLENQSLNNSQWLRENSWDKYTRVIMEEVNKLKLIES